MKLKSMLVASAAATALASGLSAEAGTYVSLFGGVSSLGSDGADLQFGPYIHTAFAIPNYGTSSTTLPAHVSNTRKFLPSDHSPQSTTGRNGDQFFTSMLVTDLDHKQQTSAVNNSVSFTFEEDNMDMGFVVGAALGYEFDMGFRVELELSQRQNDIGGPRNLHGVNNRTVYRHITNTFIGSAKFYTTSKTSITTTTTTGAATNTHQNYIALSTATKTTFIREYTLTGYDSTAEGRAFVEGDVTTFAIMANLWYDFDIGRDAPVTPFFGVGVGLANVDIAYGGNVVLRHDYNVYNGTVGTSGTVNTSLPAMPINGTVGNSDTSDWVPAWQIGGGLAFDLGNNMSLSAQYRYFGTGEVTTPRGNTFAVQSHAALLGLTIPFGRQN